MSLPQELTAFGHGLIRVVATVIVHITLPVLRDAVAISTLEVARPAEPTGTVVHIFVRVIPTVVLRVTPPGFGDAPFVGTLPFVGLAAVMLCREGHLVARCYGQTLLIYMEGSLRASS